MPFQLKCESFPRSYLLHQGTYKQPENPGPETKVGEVSVFHWNSRSIRHKLDHLQTISNEGRLLLTKLTLPH
jgi:hypothetical protein